MSFLSYPVTSQSLASWLGDDRERGTGATRLLAGRTYSCRCLLRVLLAISRMLCCVTVSGDRCYVAALLQTVPDLCIKYQAYLA